MCFFLEMIISNKEIFKETISEIDFTHLREIVRIDEIGNTLNGNRRNHKWE